MSLQNKFTQKLSRSDLADVVLVAQNKKKADLIIKNVVILDLINGGISSEITAISIVHGTIAGVGIEYENSEANEIIDAGGAYAVPGFIDGHLHIESSMMNPFEFEKMVLPLGTTTLICDPHEITNVLQKEGFAWFVRASELVHLNMFVQVSSCVPALPGIETNGGDFSLEDMMTFKNHPHVLGLAEMMNFPGVINNDESVHDKIEAFSDLNIDGHCPFLRGEGLNAYIASGIQNCHETVLLEEGREKLAKGMALIIREGSVAKNLKTLIPLVSEFNSTQCLLCTDDRNPFEIKHEGHINFMLKEMMNRHHIPPYVAYRLASYSAAKHFGLKRLGLVAPGKKADIVLVSDLKNVVIEKVFVSGKDVACLELQKTLSNRLEKSCPPLKNTIIRNEIKLEELDFKLSSGVYNLIEIVPDEIVTRHKIVNYNGKKFDSSDILYMVNVERYGKNLPVAKGLVKGFGIVQGAIAASVAHDSHNLMAAGDNLLDMQLALNTLIKSGGGLVVTHKGKILSHIPLPIAGLMGLQSSEELESSIGRQKDALKLINIKLHEPFIQMAFLALPVIPEIKLTDKGLFHLEKFSYLNLRAE